MYKEKVSFLRFSSNMAVFREKGLFEDAM